MSIPLILASQSPSRRAVLYSAGICPTVRVSHVDEPAALAADAERRHVGVEDLDIRSRVMVLATAKARTVYDAYRAVTATCSHATGDRVVAYPLRSAQVLRDEDAAGTGLAAGSGSEASRGRRVLTDTRDFSGIDMPTRKEPIGRIDIMHPGLTHVQAGPLILGCDSMFLMKGRCFGKPHDSEVARARLAMMRGNSGELWTGHCLIDFSSGETSCEASHATVRFGSYSDRDIERYIATREPLEVAGSFTLEGFGGAFVDGIEGDPHGVVGVSLPTLRHMVNDMGMEWTDLWNIARGQNAPANKVDQASGSVPPADNVHQPGDGWVDCACGRRHWGLNGAAGVLLARRDGATGAITHVVMQHRAMWSAEGGTWGIPGGAIADGESPLEGALRESYEEANITPEDIDVVGSYREDHGSWAYTTVLAFEKEGHSVTPRANDDESMRIEWMPVAEVGSQRLLSALRADWPALLGRLRALAANS